MTTQPTLIEDLMSLIRAAITAHRDLHRTYANTTACSGGIGGAALTQHCGETCPYEDRHHSDRQKWESVETAYFRLATGDPDWTDSIPKDSA